MPNRVVGTVEAFPLDAGVLIDVWKLLVLQGSMAYLSSCVCCPREDLQQAIGVLGSIPEAFRPDLCLSACQSATVAKALMACKSTNVIGSCLSCFLGGSLASSCSVCVLLCVVLLSDIVVLVVAINAVGFNVSIIVKLFEHVCTTAAGLFFVDIFVCLCNFGYLFGCTVLQVLQRFFASRDRQLKIGLR